MLLHLLSPPAVRTRALGSSGNARGEQPGTNSWEYTSPLPLVILQYKQGSNFPAAEIPGWVPWGQLCQQICANRGGPGLSRNLSVTPTDSQVFCPLLNEWNVLIGLNKPWQIPGAGGEASFP